MTLARNGSFYFFILDLGGNMKQISAEKLIEKLGCEIYPVTLVKFLLNRRRILSFFSKAVDSNFSEKNQTFKIDSSNCEACKSKDMKCRQHTSIERVIGATSALLDVDSGTYFYKNEIFKMIAKKLVIVYCPHPKLIKGPLTDEKVRKVMPLTVDDENLNFNPEAIKMVRSVCLTDLMEQSVTCWFNDDFTLMTLPEDNSASNWCLLGNK
jgi:hypothetical protein